MMPTLRALHADDFDQWLPLWQDYLIFYEHPLSEEVTRFAFGLVSERREGFIGLVVERESELLGFAHLLRHYATWSTAPRVYLEDLFVAVQERGGGLGRRLLEACYAEARALGADQIYWRTDAGNAVARGLYDQLAEVTSFVHYRAGLG